MHPSPSLVKTGPSFLPLWLRVLTFRARAEDYENLGKNHLLIGLLVTWVVGMGRYWDDPRATLLQHLGVGSVIYVFVLAALFWIIAKPLAPERFSYVGILTFIVMTSPPAALYAIPVEQWMTLAEANEINLKFLGVVALWRFFLWIHYLFKFGLLPIERVFICAVMPLGIIFATLFSLNLHHVVVGLMGGIRNADPSSQDAAYQIMFALSILGVPASALAALFWIGLVIQSWRARRQAKLKPPVSR